MINIPSLVRAPNSAVMPVASDIARGGVAATGSGNATVPAPTLLNLQAVGLTDWPSLALGVTRSGPGQFSTTKDAAQMRAALGAVTRDFIVDNVNGTNNTVASEAQPARNLSTLLSTINATAGDVLWTRIKPRASRMVWGSQGFAGTGWDPAAGAARKLIIEAFDGGPLIFVRSASSAPPAWTANANGTYTAPTGITGATNTSAPMDWLPATRDVDGVGRVFSVGTATLATDVAPAPGTYYHDTMANTVTVAGFDARNLVGDEWVTPVTFGNNITFNFSATQTSTWRLYLGQCWGVGGAPMIGTNLQAAPGLFPTVIMDRCGGFAGSVGSNGLFTLGGIDLYTFGNTYGYNHRDGQNASPNASGFSRHLYVVSEARRRTGYSGTGDDNQITGHGGASAAEGTRTIVIMGDTGPSDGRVIGSVGYSQIFVFGSVGNIGPSLNTGPRGSTISASDFSKVVLVEASLAASPTDTFNVDTFAAITCYGMDITGKIKSGVGTLQSLPVP